MQEQQAQIRITDTDSSDNCRVAAGISLGAIAERVHLDKLRYVLVEDEFGRLCGIVRTDEIVSRLSVENATERQRWHDTPLEALVTVKLDDESVGSPISRCQSGVAEIDATIISSRDEIVAVNIEDDVLVRWSAVEGVLSRTLFDPVTGLPNRAVFDRRLHEDWSRVKSRNSSIAVLMIDLDHFKNINDQHGHATGDLVLREVANCLSRQLRSYDLLARYGGDEFAAILSDCYMTDIHIPAIRLLSGISRLTAESDLLKDLSISVGAITCPGSLNVAPTRLLEAADECLYAAKRSGRNCAFTLDVALSGNSGKPTRLNVDSDLDTAHWASPNTIRRR